MLNKIRLLVLIAILIHHTITIIQIVIIEQEIKKTTEPELKPMRDYGKRFFTIWTFVFQIIYMCLTIVNEIFIINHKNLLKLNSIIYWAFVFPWTLFVFCMFWTVYSYDPELVFPKLLRNYVSDSINESLHTNILVLLMLEFFFNYEKPPNMKFTLNLIVAYSALYIIIFYYTYLVDNVWLYKLFSYLSLIQHIVFYFLNCSFAVLTGYVGMKIQEKKYYHAIKMEEKKLIKD